MSTSPAKYWKTRWVMVGLALMITLNTDQIWSCYDSYDIWCPPNIIVHLNALRDQNPNEIIILVAILVATVLSVQTITAIQLWHGEISVLIVLGALLGFGVAKRMVFDYGGLPILLLCSGVLWFFWRGHVENKSAAFPIVIAIGLLAAIATYHYARLLLLQISEPGLIIGLSLPSIFFGSWLMLGLGLRFYHQLGHVET